MAKLNSVKNTFISIIKILITAHKVKYPKLISNLIDENKNVNIN
jgi:hypothetical protein